MATKNPVNIGPGTGLLLEGKKPLPEPQRQFMISEVQWLSAKGSFTSEWVIKFNSLLGDSGHRGPYSPYQLCNHTLHIEITIFPHIDNTQSTGHN